MSMHVSWYRWVICVAVFVAAGTAFGGDEGAAATPIAQAIREAEGDLRHLERERKAAPATWGVSEILGLVALTAAIGLMIWAMRWTRGRLFAGPSGREMRIMDRMAISRSTTLLIVRVRGKDYWLGDNAGGVRVLAELPPDHNEALPETLSPDPEKSTSATNTAT